MHAVMSGFATKTTHHVLPRRPCGAQTHLSTGRTRRKRAPRTGHGLCAEEDGPPRHSQRLIKRARFGKSDLAHLLTSATAPQAALAPVVTAAARAGDAVALEIIDAAAAGLVDCARPDPQQARSHPHAASEHSQMVSVGEMSAPRPPPPAQPPQLSLRSSASAVQAEERRSLSSWPGACSRRMVGAAWSRRRSGGRSQRGSRRQTSSPRQWKWLPRGRLGSP